MSVARERTAWRDHDLAVRHRDWGVAVAAVDLDFILAEYNFGVVFALIEYKHRDGHRHKWNERALCDLATRAGVPASLVWYTRHAERGYLFNVVALNGHAEARLPGEQVLTELAFAAWLHELRGLRMPVEQAEWIIANPPPFVRVR